MFNDFDDSAQEDEGNGRRAASLGVSAILFLLIGSGVAAAMAGVRVVQQRREAQDVTFEDLPTMPEPEVEEAPPPPPPPPPRRQRRPDRASGTRPVIDGPPDGIPDEVPEEADGELAETENTGPIDNDAEMGEGGDAEPEPAPAPAPVAPVVPVQRAERPAEQVRETIRRARFLADRSGCRRIIIPDAVANALGAETVRIRVRALVGTDGNVQSARVVSGHPDVPEDLVLRCAEQWVFAPATLPDGTAVPYPAIRTFVIRPRT